MVTHQINYDFYNDYLYDKTFVDVFEKRKSYIRDKYKINRTDNELIKEYFVEIFSWTVMDKSLLTEINDTIDTFVPNGILIDPCSGNSFHTFIFNQFCNRQVITSDIQPEENAWIETYSNDGLDFIQNMDIHEDKVLLLSWLDSPEIRLYNLIKCFKGKLIISIGNYRHYNCKEYLDELNNYKLVKSYNCSMPWGLIEEIKIFTK